jgi:hypothetical protein
MDINNNGSMECPLTIQFDKHPETVAAVDMAFNHLEEKYDNFDKLEAWTLIDNVDYEERIKKSKKDLKRKVAKQAKFKAPGLKRAPNRMNLFREQFKQECKDEGREYSKEYFESAYKALSEEKLAELDEECATLKTVYDEKYEKLKLRAMYNGEYPLEKPKRQCSSWILFSKACHAKDTKLLSKTIISKLKKEDTSDFKKTIALIKKLWDGLKHEERSKFDTIVEAGKETYKFKEYEYEMTSLECQIRHALSKNETIMVSEFESELEKLREEAPEGYEDYTGSADYEPLYDFSEFE